MLEKTELTYAHMKIRLKPADIVFSRLIRKRDGWRCIRCKTQYEPPTQALHCSHFWGRSNKKTRFDPRNCDALCYGCHRLWEGRKRFEYSDFKLIQLGKKQYIDLENNARLPIKFGEIEFKQMAVFLRKNGLNGIFRILKEFR